MGLFNLIFGNKDDHEKKRLMAERDAIRNAYEDGELREDAIPRLRAINQQLRALNYNVADTMYCARCRTYHRRPQC